MVVISVVISFILGILSSLVAMKVHFKYRTIQKKINTYELLIQSWIMMRNMVCQKERQKFDQFYAQAVAAIGAVYIFSEDDSLSEEIHGFNKYVFEKMVALFDGDDASALRSELDQLETKAIPIVKKMRKNVEESTVLSLRDILHIFCHLFGCK